MDGGLKCKITKLLEKKKKQEKIWGSRARQELLDLAPKTWPIKIKIDKVEFIQV